MKRNNRNYQSQSYSRTRMQGYVRRAVASSYSHQVRIAPDASVTALHNHAGQVKPTVAGAQRPLVAAVRRAWALLGGKSSSHWRKYNWGVVGLSVAVIVVLAMSALAPLLDAWQYKANYSLAAAKSLLEPTPDYIQKKLTYDMRSNAWLFNQDKSQPLPLEGQQTTSIGDIKYSAQLPGDLIASSGLTLTDTTNKLGITLKPQFAVSSGQEQDGHVVYPLVGSKSQLVYSFKNNGVKEDIILYQSPGDTAEYSYSMQLPTGMEARLQKDGSVGIFGGDPALFGNISYGSDKDKAMVEKARQNSAKDHLYYEIPAPIITGKNTDSAKAHFVLNGETLTVRVNGLAGAHYPLSIDPSFVMDTSGCAWQQTGNNESNISYSGCQLSRSTLSGGTVGSWTASTSAATGNLPAAKVSGYLAYNGYMYAVSFNASGFFQSSYYAPINASTGALGQFVVTSSTLEDRRGALFTIVNGYIYAIGGVNVNKTVEYAKINSNGTISSWAYTSSISVGHMQGGIAAYNNRIYAISGCSAQLAACTGQTAVVEYATINGDGSLSAWSATSSLATGNYPEPTFWMTATGYNGYLYAMGGQGTTTTIYYTSVNSNGSITAWASTGAVLPFASDRGLAATVSNGYLYVMGGNANAGAAATVNTVYLAKIYASGKLGPLQQTTSFTTPRTLIMSTTYNGRVYISGGSDSTAATGATDYLDTQYTTISTALGDTSAYSTAANYDSGTARFKSGTVAAGGYLYIVGGASNSNAATEYGTVRYAPINSDGSLGTWTTSASFKNTQTGSGTFCATAGNCPGRKGVAVAVYNNYLYIAGGQSNGNGTYWSDVQSAPLNATTGAPGTWTTLVADFTTNNATTFSNTNGRADMAMEIYNGYIYLVGGVNNNNTTVFNTIYYAPVTSTGGVGTFAATTGLPGDSNNGGESMGTFVANGKFYVASGRVQGSAGNCNSPVGGCGNYIQFTTINSNGSLGNGNTTTSWTDANAVANGGSGSTYSTTIFKPSFAVSNGYVYVIGGVLNTNAGVTTVYRAKINTNGSLGSWSSSTNFSGGRYWAGTATYNGFLYVVAGCDQIATLGGNCNAAADYLPDYQYAQIYNGGGGADGTWVSGGSPGGRFVAMSVASGGYLYAMGGCTGFLVGNCTNVTTGTQAAPINSDGSLGAWTAGTNLPIALMAAGATVANGYVYIVGGCGNASCGTVQNTVYSALICTGSNSGVDGCGATGGTLGTWHSLSTVAARWGANVVVSNGYLYVAGGLNAGVYLNSVQSAQILPSGGLGSWGSPGSGATFTTARYGAGLVSYGDYLYLLGGNSSTDQLSDVQMAQVQANGQLSAWSATTAMPATATGGLAGGANGYIYFYGVRSGNNYTNQLVYAPVLSNGMLGKWTITPGNSAVTGLNGSAGVIYNGYIYRISGFDGSATVANSSYYAPLMSTPQIGRYSALLTTDKATAPVNFFANVNTQSSYTSNISLGFVQGLSVASPALGSLTTTTGIVPSTKYGLTPNGDGGLYYRIVITLDDSQSMTYGESSGSYMSYLQLNYHPNPSMRLRGGKTFNANSLQSIDAP